MKMSIETAEALAGALGIEALRLSGLNWELGAWQTEGDGWVRLTIEGGQREWDPRHCMVRDLTDAAERLASDIEKLRSRGFTVLAGVDPPSGVAPEQALPAVRVFEEKGCSRTSAGPALRSPQSEERPAKHRLLDHLPAVTGVMDGLLRRIKSRPELLEHPALARLLAVYIERVLPARSGLTVQDASGDKAWASAATPEERRQMLEIMEACRARMGSDEG